MVGILVQLAFSWLIIWHVQKGNLSVLGLQPTKQRIIHFTYFLLLTAICCSLGFVMKMFFGKQAWQVNPQLSIPLVLNGIWWNLKSVLFEELIFRGVLFYMLLKKLTPTKAILISATAFGIYHWFSFGVFGNIIPMIVVFFITGIMGLLLAYAYAKTYSLYYPIAIHLGWNFTQIFVFSQGPIGNGILVATAGGEFRTDSYLIFIVVTFLPIILALLINFLLLRKQKQIVV
jgi:hypothetical protein